MAGGLAQGTPRASLPRDAMAPALSILHASQDSRGYIDEATIHEVASATGQSPAEVYGAILAYPRFSVEPREAVRAVCTGPVCRMMGAHEASKAFVATAETHCLGLCDQAVAALVEGVPRVFRRGALVPPEAPAAVCEPERSPFFGPDDPWEAVRRSRSLAPGDVIAAIAESGLRGRGGAGFPAGRKWEAVRGAPGDRKVIICNADESEPGTFKDRVLLDHQPRRVLAGMAIAAHAVGAETGIVYLRYEYRPQYERLLAAVEDLRSEGLLGGTFDVVIRRAAGAYVCGEETALLNSLEGRRPIPRDRPPYPFSRGLFGWPTLIQNVETLAAVPAIVARGPSWFRDAGSPKLYSVSGDVGAPGVYELPMTVTARELIARAGGEPERVKAFTLGGLSGGLLPAAALDTPLDFEAPGAHGASLGSGGVIVLDGSRCAVRFALDAVRFFAEESCGKCFPCRIGSTRLLERFRAASQGERVDPAELADLASVLAMGSACGLGPSAALVANHLLAHVRDELEAHSRGRCPAGECMEAA